MKHTHKNPITNIILKTEHFPPELRIRQECPISPLLFNTVRNPTYSSKTRGEKKTDVTVYVEKQAEN